jgi:hypothetical protein
MPKVDSLIAERTKKKDTASKNASAVTGRTSFTGLFPPVELTQQERDLLITLLKDYAEQDANVEQDVSSLASITSEIKSINSQRVP